MTTTATKHTPKRAYTCRVDSERCEAHADTAAGNEGGRCMKPRRYGNLCQQHAAREYDRQRAENAELRKVLQNFQAWHADHFGDFASDINAQLLCLANDTEAALAKAKW